MAVSKPFIECDGDHGQFCSDVLSDFRVVVVVVVVFVVHKFALLVEVVKNLPRAFVSLIIIASLLLALLVDGWLVSWLVGWLPASWLVRR